jgi:hypothetical protein
MASGASRYELDDEAKGRRALRPCVSNTDEYRPAKRPRVVCRQCGQVGTFMMLVHENRLGFPVLVNLFPDEFVPTILTSCNRICTPPLHEQDPERSDRLAERIHYGAHVRTSAYLPVSRPRTNNEP